ncbi:MAG TPA: DUF5996 family protein [Gammaproteobacteria bacterium]
MNNSSTRWPELPPPEAWADTFATVHMWTQIVGKIRLATSPRLNHSWGSTLYVTANGLTTSPMPAGDGSFDIAFDFVHHALQIRKSDGRERRFALSPMSVADFHRDVMTALAELDIEVSIYTRPVEVVDAIPFEQDRVHAGYDAGTVNRVWRAFAQADRVFKVFRARFHGKSSPSHFFWGAFDLAVTRFSGRGAPRHPGGAPNCADWVMQEAYSHELASAGFWPGAGLGEAAFYAYAWPQPAGYSGRKVQPAAAYFSETLQEFILPYDAVRRAHDPDAALLAFLQSTYESAADLAHWDRASLERGGDEDAS